MEELSLERINQSSPYRVYRVSQDKLTFDTDFGVSYDVGFDPEESFWEDGAYQFYIINTNDKTSPLDSKLKETVLCIIEEFFRSNPSILLYICETGDAHQSARSRLFTRWFNEARYKELYYFQTVTIVAEGISNYAAIIVQKSNPELDTIIEQFNGFAKLLSNKPE